MAQLWKGRFQKELAKETNDFNASIAFDSRMYEEDIRGSMAHAAMLGQTGIIEKSESDKIIDGLEQILNDLKNGSLAIDPEAEDIHTFVEGELTKRLGQTGKRLHTARSRNDQVALDIRMYLKKECDVLSEKIKSLVEVLCEKAEQQDTKKRMNALPLGSGALAGTTYPIDRTVTAGLLGFDKICENSLDGVSDRDFCIELAAALSTVMVHLSRFSEEIILWCSWEFKFVELDDAFSTGSSIMPQKKNPDIAELVRGKSGRVFGDLMTLLTMLKGTPLAYNKDMQEDKEAIFDAVDTVKMCLNAFTPMIETMTVLRENMRHAAAKGFINATDCADYLVGKGLPFRDAYKATGELVALCIQKGTTLEALPLADYQNVCALFDEDVYKAIDLDRCVKQRLSRGGPAPESVLAQIAHTKAILQKY